MFCRVTARGQKNNTALICNNVIWKLIRVTNTRNWTLFKQSRLLIIPDSMYSHCENDPSLILDWDGDLHAVVVQGRRQLLAVTVGKAE